MSDQNERPHRPPEQFVSWQSLQTLRSDLSNHLATLWRRKFLIVGLVTLVMTAAFVYIYRLQPIYTAQALVIVEGRTSNVVDLEEVAQPLRVGRASILGEVEVIRSRNLADIVIERMNLAQNGYFNPRLAPPQPLFATLNPISLAKQLVKAVLPEDWIEAIKGRPPTALSEAQQRERERTQIVNAFLRGLVVRPRGFSNVLEIGYNHPDPHMAASLANTVADAYILNQLEAKFEKTRQATTWLNDRLTDLRVKVEASERAVEAFRGQNQLVGEDGRRLTEQKISELNNQAILAQTEVAAAQARYQQVQRLLDQGEAIEAAPEVIRSPLIQNLRAQETEMLRNLANLSTRYGESHPTMINLRSELRDLREKIGAEVRKIAQLLRNELDVAQSRYATILNGLKELERRAGVEGQVSVQLREMEREARANRALYEAFLSRFKETSNQQDLQQADARIISRAAVPLAPSAPNKKLMLVATFIIAAFGASGLAIFLERFDRGLRGAELVEGLTGLPVIAMIPKVSGSGGRAKVADYIVEKPMSAAAESIRNLTTGVFLSSQGARPQVLCLTSAVPGEGKTVISVWLARSLAMQGKKTLLIDFDMRRPRLHEVLGVTNDVSLRSIADSDVSWRDCLRKDQRTSADVLVSAPMEGRSLEFLGSETIGRMLEEIRQEYQMVIVDSPPMLAVSDARVIGHLVDATVFVIKWDKTERGFVEAAMKQVHLAGIDIAGVALSQVDTRKHVRYGYRDYGSYYGKYRDYYSKA